MSIKHPIPPAALKKHIAILGMNGSGKTSVAKSQIIEPALDAGERVCNIDPTGVGWGLRLSSSGKEKGFAIYIVGGEHADFPLLRRDGKAWGEIVGTSSDSYVFDTSQMTVEDRGQWFTDFAETLIRKNKGPINLVLDEAHLFAPQAGARGGGIAPKMLHATNNLLALGRSKGLIVTMISQRPAKLHKDSLTQAHTLIAMALMAPQDRNAVKDWIADQADVETGKEIIASLPTLKPGEGWVWAPKENVLDRVMFSRPRTFDSSSAPDDTAGDVVLSPINPDAIKARLASVAKETVANDPKALRAEIARLTAEMNKMHKNAYPAAPDPEALTKAEERGFERARKQLAKAADRVAVETILASLGDLRIEIAPLLELIDRKINDAKQFDVSLANKIAFTPTAQPAEARRSPAAMPSMARRPSAADSPVVAGDGTYSNAQRRVLRSLTMWKSLGHESPSREMVAAVAGYRPSSGGFNNLLGGLATMGAVGKPMPGHVSLLVDGIEVIGKDDGRDLLLSVLSNPQKRIVGALIDHPNARTREQVGELTGYSASSGGFNNLLGSLGTLGIVVKPQPGYVALSDWAQELLEGHVARKAA